MRKWWILGWVVVLGLTLAPLCRSWGAEHDDAELQMLKAQLTELQKRIEVLEGERAKGKEEGSKKKEKEASGVKGIADGIQGFKIGAQIRPRFESRDSGFGLFGPGKFNKGDDRGSYTTMRSRLNVQGNVTDQVGLFLQLQDVRVWGQEWDTLDDDDADHQDLHQAYIDLGGLKFDDLGFQFPQGLHFRIGRQELVYEEHRLIGNVDWTQRARSFDAFRMMYDAKDWALHGWLAKLDEEFAFSVPELYDAFGGRRPAEAYVDTGTNEERDFYGLFLQRKGILGGGLSLYALGDHMVRAREDGDIERVTLGSRWGGKRGPFDWRLEFYWQGGDWGNRDGEKVDIGANMVGASFGYAFPWRMKPKVTLWYDYLSGDEDPFDGKHRVFDTLYATNHKFYGYMDQFLNIPVHTDPQGRSEGLGLQDFAFKLSLQPTPKLQVAADLHHFRTAEDDPRTRTGSRVSVDDHLGEELDITLKYLLASKVTFQVGYSHFWTGQMVSDAKRLGRVGDSSDEDWFYSFLNLGF